MQKKLFQNSLFRHTFSWFFIAIFCLATLCSCGSPSVSKRTSDPFVRPINNPSPFPLPEIPVKDQDINDTEIGKQIRQDYFKYLRKQFPDESYNLSDIRIVRYYGTYSNCIAITLENGMPYPMGPVLMIVGDTLFNMDGRGITIWTEGQFYGLQNAYDLDLLTNDDLRNIAYFYQET